MLAVNFIVDLVPWSCLESLLLFKVLKMCSYAPQNLVFLMSLNQFLEWNQQPWDSDFRSRSNTLQKDLANCIFKNLQNSPILGVVLLFGNWPAWMWLLWSLICCYHVKYTLNLSIFSVTDYRTKCEALLSVSFFVQFLYAWLHSTVISWIYDFMLTKMTLLLLP